MAPSKATQQAVIGLALAAIASIIMYQLMSSSSSSNNKAIDGKDESGKKASAADAAVQKRAAEKARDLPHVRFAPETKSTSKSSDTTRAPPAPSSNNKPMSSEKALHHQIEELDKKGKKCFKAKQYIEAADAFTGALDLIANFFSAGGAGAASSSSEQSTSLARQVVTLMNNRSAMYEKGGLVDLALADCDEILDKEIGHTKARTRKLRILEQQKRYAEALVQVCALQLKFMQENRAQLRMGVPLQPPVPQSKLEDLIAKLLPSEVDKYVELAAAKTDRPLPSNFTLTQLLKSFSGYNAWMSAAARDGNVTALTEALEAEEDGANKASLYLKRGRRYAHDKMYEKAVVDFETGLALVEDKPEWQDAMEGDDFARLLEWVGMARHWKYKLEDAMKAYEKCSELEPTNPALLVKRAGVKMDAQEHDAAIELFDTALGLDPETTDALLHRANLRLLQQNVDEAKADLTLLLNLRPDHMLARLRLATIYMATDDTDSAMVQLDKAEAINPNSSEVASYRGEMCFAKGDLEGAKENFEKAMATDPMNPMPYVNTALVTMNTPPSNGKPPDTASALEMLEKAIAIDPQMHSAYMHLGQLRLAMATDLSVARDVVELYDQALEHCRSPEEIKDICGVRLLTVAQVEAATMMGMEHFSMQ